MSDVRFVTHLGMRVESMKDGEAVVRLTLGPEHRNRRGVAHGGVWTSLLDTALGAAVISSMPKEWWCATISLSTEFVAGTGEGEVVCTGRVLRRGARVAFAEGEARDASGRLIAVGHGSWNLWPYKPGVGPGETRPGSHVVVRESGERIRVGKIVAVGRNYAEHVREMGGAPSSPPVLFFKPATALVHDGGTVRIPTDAGSVHHEVELVAVIGKPGRAIDEASAIDHVLGYAVGLDLTLRDLQAEAKQRGEPWAVAKGFDGSAPVSLVAPREEVGDGSGLAISLAVSGETRQEGSTSQMIRPVAALVAYASRRITLERGDLLFTGTPAGVGPVRDGDVLEARIERVGSLTVRVENEE